MKLSSRFGHNAHALRSRTPLTEDQLRSVAPSIFAEAAHDSRSERYTYIPTSTVLAGLQKEGFQPFMVAQTRVRDEGKTRLLPLHASTSRELAAYLRRREACFDRPISPFMFVSRYGNRIDQGTVHRTFYVLSRSTGLRGLDASHGPRLHDFRHRFAVRVLARWYQTGEDAARRLPVLSAYLGHVRVADTYWYLSAWPELMVQAMSRLETRWGEPS